MAPKRQKSLETFFCKHPKSRSGPSNQSNQEENVIQPEIPLQTSGKQEFDIDSLEADPAKRIPILDHDVNHRHMIRRAYYQKGPCQPRNHKLPQRTISGEPRRFRPKWFGLYAWLEYSVSKDAAYCLPCYLFNDDNAHHGGSKAFSLKGFRNWGKTRAFKRHALSKFHKQAMNDYLALVRPEQSVISAFDRQSNQAKHEHRVRLSASIDVVRLLMNQGMAFRGHDESQSSLNKGNFLEILSWYAKKCDNIRDYVLDHAPRNDQMTSPMIQKDIVTACKIETVKAIIMDLNNDYFALLVDESFDVSRKEQMTIVLRYVDRRGFVMERLLDIIHIRDTSALSLKNAIVDLLAHYSLSLSYVRGQCYDGASNMQGRINGLKMLIKQESRSAHSIHCFAHQLQLTLVAVSKKCIQVGELVLLVSNILNVLGASFKRMDEFRESQRKRVQEELDMGELTTGRGLLQELGLVKAGDTRWGSHYKSFCNFISSFGTVIDVLDNIVVDAHSLDDRAKTTGYLRACQTYEVAFMLHLMKRVLGITDELNKSLQKKEQDIANAMILVKVAKRRLQELRDTKWSEVLHEVSIFCKKYDISIPNFEMPYVNSGRSRRKPADYTVLHHYRVGVFCEIIDWQLQELNDRFDEVTTDLLHGVSCLNPVDSFSSFDTRKIIKLAELYPDDFNESTMWALENQLETYIIDVRDNDERFSNLSGLCELSKMLVQTKKHLNYPLVFRLVKLVLLLPVATATVERAFSAMKFIKNDMRNRMNDDFLRGCMVPYVERDVFSTISNDDIIKTFQEMKTRRVQL